MALIGLRDLYYAPLTADSGTTLTYGAPVKIAPAISANISPAVNTGTLYADDGPDETASSLGEITVELQVKDLPHTIKAALLGHKVDDNGVLCKNADDIPPYVAVGFRSLKSDGKTFRYVWLYKGKFQPVNENYKTKEDTIEFQTPTIIGTFVKRQKDGAWETVADKSTANYGATWFTAAQLTGGA